MSGAADGGPSHSYTPHSLREAIILPAKIHAHEAGEDLPNAVMDLPEASQKPEDTVIDLPVELDQEIAQMKLETMGLNIDALTQEQIMYATDYSAGT